MKITSVSLIVAVALAAAAHAENRIGYRHDVPDASYIALGSTWDSVGRVVIGSGICTGSLVSPTKILSAAHCVDEDNNGILDDNITFGPSGTTTFLLGDDVDAPDHTLEIASVQFNDYGGDPSKDLAIFTLSAPFNTLPSMNISYENPLGLTATSVGYGVHGDGVSFVNSLDGNRRAMNNVIDYVQTDAGDMFNTIRVDFDNPDGTTSSMGSSAALPFEGSTGGGDSGGPIIVDFNDGNGPVIVGALNGGFNDFGPFSEYGDVSIWSALANPLNQALLANNGISPVPEPSSLLLLGIAGFAVGSGRRRRTK